MLTDGQGSCDLASIYGPVEQLRYGNNPDGCGQMVHFTNSHGFNMFRLPVAWQFLVNTCGGTLNTTNFAEYNLLVQGCLATGSYCIIDIHNFARWDGAIIGQGGPSNEEFASLWSQLATQYASESKMVFGIMNEPHDSNGYLHNIPLGSC
jgi:endoglucanase